METVTSFKLATNGRLQQPHKGGTALPGICISHSGFLGYDPEKRIPLAKGLFLFRRSRQDGKPRLLRDFLVRFTIK
jgi:hypothetical protein